MVHVRFKDGSASTDDGIGVRPISGWHDNGDKANCFEQKSIVSIFWSTAISGKNILKNSE